jgi:hypothetical protein
MKISKTNAVTIWKQIEDDLSPRLYLTVMERVVYSHLLPIAGLKASSASAFPFFG